MLSGTLTGQQQADGCAGFGTAAYQSWRSSMHLHTCAARLLLAGLLAAPCRLAATAATSAAAAISRYSPRSAARQPHHAGAQLLEGGVVADAQHLAAGRGGAGAEAVKEAGDLAGQRTGVEGTAVVGMRQRKQPPGRCTWHERRQQRCRQQSLVQGGGRTRCWLVSSSAASTSSMSSTEVAAPAMATWGR